MCILLSNCLSLGVGLPFTACLSLLASRCLPLTVPFSLSVCPKDETEGDTDFMDRYTAVVTSTPRTLQFVVGTSNPASFVKLSDGVSPAPLSTSRLLRSSLELIYVCALIYT